MMKDTALVSFLGVNIASAEIFRRAQRFGKSDFKNLEAYVAAALVYWGLTVLFTFFQARLERGSGAGTTAHTSRGPWLPRRSRASHTAEVTSDERRRGGPHRRSAQASGAWRWSVGSTWRSAAARWW